jgi:sec-independent protein translocase protein TatA
MPGATELIVVLLILLLLFGATRLPRLARSMGSASKEFKQGLKEGAPDVTVEGPCPFCDAKLDADTKFCPSCGKSAEEIVAKKRETATAP